MISSDKDPFADSDLGIAQLYVWRGDEYVHATTRERCQRAVMNGRIHY